VANEGEKKLSFSQLFVISHDDTFERDTDDVVRVVKENGVSRVERTMTDLKRLGKYEIIKEIGRGGFAVVYKARDTALDRVVALKVLHPYWTADPGFAARFQREARTAARLRHPGIVTIHEADEAEGQLYIAMEYLPGRTLQALLEEEGALPLERALPILKQVAAALDYAHGQGVVHRDVKPANVIVEETESGVRATLTDFGLVKAMAESVALTSQGTLLGSPEYMAPEQADPERAAGAGPAADRYALGIVAYRMLTGRVPFPGNTPATLNAHEHKPVPPPRSFRPGLPRAVGAALLKMLAKAPADRFASAGAFVTRLRDALLAETQARQRKARLEPLYQQLKAAAAAKDWPEVLALGGQIRALDPGYRDVRELVEQARAQMRPRPAERRSLPGWAWILGGILALALLLGGVYLGTRIGSEPTPEPTATAAVVQEPTATPGTSLTPTTTDTPTLAPTSTHTPAPTPTPTVPAAAPPRVREKDGMVKVYVPAGEFEMGSTDGYSDEQPVHTVALDALWIDQTEVTNAQYTLCVKDGKCEQSSYADDADFNRDDYPVVGVFWNDAVTYCQWAGARLPTEAEWEYAARGLEGNVYPWGDETPTCELAQYTDCSGYTVPVGSLPDGASWCGALGMAGNVWEWVADWYDEDYYGSSPSQNPAGPSSGEYKVLRGGSWLYPPTYVRSANRFRNDPDYRYNLIGFRCARGSE